jgi:hypothetical protein
MRKGTGFFWLRPGSSGGIVAHDNDPSDSITGLFLISNKKKKKQLHHFSSFCTFPCGEESCKAVQKGLSFKVVSL